MFTTLTKFEDKMSRNGAGGAGGAGGADGAGGPDYGQMMADLFNAMAKKQYEAAVKKEPAKANKTITQG